MHTIPTDLKKFVNDVNSSYNPVGCLILMKVYNGSSSTLLLNIGSVK